MFFTDYSYIDTDSNNISRVLDSILNKDLSIWESHPGSYEGVMGWVDVIGFQTTNTLHDEWDPLSSLPFECTDVVLIGFGGSILGGQVLIHSLSSLSNIKIWYMDRVHPEEIEDVQNLINLPTTVFIIASKSGTTFETRCLERFFFELRNSKFPHLDNGRCFFAITDPYSELDHLAVNSNYKKVIYSDPSVGGRFSALTEFGLFPAYLMGGEIDSFVQNIHKRTGNVDPSFDFFSEVTNLVYFIANSLKLGRDKLTIKASPTLNHMLAWIEQLISESLGKDGKGVIVIIREPDMNVSAYGPDRAFLFIEDEKNQDPAIPGRISDLTSANFPTLHIKIEEIENNIGPEIYKWELTVATLGNLLGINPFDQPEVERSKILATNLLDDVTEGKNISRKSTLSISELLERCRPGYYIGILAYLPRKSEVEVLLSDIRRELTRITSVPTTLGYGPSYLHSTGQCHKGGPKNGLFIQITYDADSDISVPDAHFSFGDISIVQSEGDLRAMLVKNIPITRHHLGKDKIKGLKLLLNSLSHRDCHISPPSSS